MYDIMIYEVGVNMDVKELDKAINNVVASFLIDDIKVSSEFIWELRQKYIYEKCKNNLSRRLVKKEKK